MSKKSKDPQLYVDHIRNEVIYLLRCSKNRTQDAFVADETLTRAVVRSLEVIGEATKKLPRSFREEHDEISWSQMAGMRAVLTRLVEDGPAEEAGMEPGDIFLELDGNLKPLENPGGDSLSSQRSGTALSASPTGRNL